MPNQFFRAGAGAVIANARGQVLAFERAKFPGAWQFPQGGMDPGEEPDDTVAREVMEETGLARERLVLLDVHPELIVYELPPEYRTEKSGRGQVHRWYLFGLPAGEPVLPSPGEFRAWRWASFDEVIRDALAFRQPVYRRLRERFAPRLEALARGEETL
jgi:putative (di)nucleoside polyphosphate hydrolase